MPSSSPLDNLVRIGQLKPEPPDRDEFAGLLRSGRLRLEDAANQALSIESRFDLGYITDPKGKAKSVQLTLEGKAHAESVLRGRFGRGRGTDG